jgi:hypothetical protein
VDIFAHGLWVGVGIAASSRHKPISTKTSVTTLALAVLPDLAHGLPLVIWGLFGDGSAAKLWAYALALPGKEPAMPPIVTLIAHHLHCTFHSAIVASIITVILWAVINQFWLPLLGWWSHIAIDVFTHSAEFYAAPVFYPITELSFDGIAWNTPWFIVVNYSALILSIGWLWWRKQ